tara:strand:+ start:622 stop:762 length:141 start_codon:yes stop_codon:yes gene_type:complete
MIKNIIIISLVGVIYTGMTGPEALEWISIGLDKLQDLVYNVKSEVN